MHTIYKFDTDKVPKLAAIKHVAWDQKVEKIQVWAEVFVPFSTDQYHNLVVLGTGWQIPYPNRHIATVLEPSGFVWHIYEKNSK